MLNGDSWKQPLFAILVFCQIMKRLTFPLILALLFMFVSCTTKTKELSSEEKEQYVKSIDAWHQERLESLRSEEGWLNLAGLFWLEPGLNTFGTSASADLQFPEGSLPDLAGYFNLESRRVTLHVKSKAGITVNGEDVREAEVFSSDSVKKIVMGFGDYRWSIIKREDKIGVRLRNLNHPRLKAFQGIDRYPVDPQYRITASFQVTDTVRYISITNVLGQTIQQLSPGTLVFDWEGKTHTLDVIDEDNGGDYFVILADQTTGKSTYSGGRFLYVPRPDSHGEVTLDFNKAYNPPCVFSPFATCPLPPKQNHLSFAVEAGEKDFHLD